MAKRGSSGKPLKETMKFGAGQSAVAWANACTAVRSDCRSGPYPIAHRLCGPPHTLAPIVNAHQLRQTAIARSGRSTHLLEVELGEFGQRREMLEVQQAVMLRSHPAKCENKT